MNREEFVCRAAIAFASIYDQEARNVRASNGEAWSAAISLWESRPDWMKPPTPTWKDKPISELSDAESEDMLRYQRSLIRYIDDPAHRVEHPTFKPPMSPPEIRQ